MWGTICVPGRFCVAAGIGFDICGITREKGNGDVVEVEAEGKAAEMRKRVVDKWGEDAMRRVERDLKEDETFVLEAMVKNLLTVACHVVFSSFHTDPKISSSLDGIWQGISTSRAYHRDPHFPGFVY